MSRHKPSYPSLSHKRVAISGATGGLGRELCRSLCTLGAELYLLDRNKQKSLSLIEELRADLPQARLTHITLDLEDMEGVRAVAEELKDISPHCLILNAGAYSIPRHKCSTGYDNVFQINCVSPLYLARALLPTVEQNDGKIVVVGSIAHNYSLTDKRDVDFSTRSAASKVYGNAKRYLMFALMGERCVSITHPGIAVTGITGHYPKLIYALIKYPMKLIFMSPKKASLSILEGLFTDCKDNEWIGPRLFNVWGKPKKQALHTATQEEKQYIKAKGNEIVREVSLC